MQLAVQIILLIAGFALLIKGADYFVDGSSALAELFGVPQLIIGLTIVAMGTSAPEAAVSISGAFAGSADISIGNVVGSNILNIFLILGIAAVLIPIAVGRSTIRIELPFLIVVSVVFFLLGLDGKIGRIDGVILWALFALYLTYLFMSAKNNPQLERDPAKRLPVWKILLMVGGGLVMIVIGGRLTVSAASEVARIFGMSERYIGLTIVAFGTSLPELFTSTIAAKKGNADLAIGNIVGSNVFNLLFVIGTASLIIPINFAVNFRPDALIAIAAAAVLLLCTVRGRKLKRLQGIILLACYAVYFIITLL